MTALHQDSWHLHSILEGAPGLKVLAETLADLVDEGHPIAVGTADLKYSNGLFRFQERHPERFTQFGISEQNMVTAAAGMATTGLFPYVSTFASFLALLCCEQIRTDVAYTNLPVRLIGHHARVLRDLAPRDRGPGDHAQHRHPRRARAGRRAITGRGAAGHGHA